MPKAVVCRELGPPEKLRLETFASAPLAPGQVRVAIHAAGINFPDILMAAGEYQLKPPLPFTPGVEAAGDVVEINAAEGVAVGDRVIVTASSDEKLAIAKARGADHLIRYDQEPFRDAVKRITDGQGADVVFDPVGGEVFENSLRCIAWGARILVIGFTGGIGLARTNLVLIKGASVLGVRAGEAVRKNPALGEVRQ